MFAGLGKTCEAPASSREKADFQIQEEKGDRSEGVTRPVSAQKEKPDVKTPENKTSAAVTPNILGEALQQLPLLNALLMELSQLSGQTPHQPPSVHPNLAWIYRPASAEPSRKTKEGTKNLKSHRNCSTTLEQEKSKSCRKKLVFGTTKTFDLRMKKVKGKEREKKLCQKGSRRKSQASCLSEDVKTAVERETEESHKLSPGNSEKASECVRSDISARNKDESERQSQSHHSEFDRRAEDDDSSRGSDSSVSDSAGGGNEEKEEEEEYADDFNSLEPSDAYSPVSSPESSRAKTPKPPVPVPVPAPWSPPRRSLHVIRAPPHAAALSVSSSDDADRDTSASVQTVLSRKQTEENRRSRSDASGSSLEDEEDEEELGSLDFRKEYKHISELVANKLPGYTM